MSKKNSQKELQGVYKRCLSALNVTYKHHLPDAAECRKIAEQATKAAQNAGDVSELTRDLYNARLVSHFQDPNRAAKEQIRRLMAIAD